jgi:hypothetical protein
MNAVHFLYAKLSECTSNTNIDRPGKFGNAKDIPSYNNWNWKHDRSNSKKTYCRQNLERQKKWIAYSPETPSFRGSIVFNKAWGAGPMTDVKISPAKLPTYKLGAIIREWQIRLSGQTCPIRKLKAILLMASSATDT